MRSHQQVLKNIAGGIKEDTLLWKTDKPQWRTNQNEYANKDNRPTAIANTRLRFKIQENVKSEMKESRLMDLNKEHFKGWKRQWCSGYDSDEVSAEFDEVYDEQGLAREANRPFFVWGSEFNLGDFALQIIERLF